MADRSFHFTFVRGLVKALVVRSRSSEKSSKSSSVERKRSSRLEGPRASWSVWLLEELEYPFLLEGSGGATKLPEGKNFARITGTAFAVDSSMRFSDAIAVGVDLFTLS